MYLKRKNEMAILDILHFPDSRLRNRAKRVDTVDDSVRQLVDDMLETMYEAPGIGLASTQVNDSRSVVVIDISDERDQPLCLINPRILEKSGEEEMDEGCLSVPDIYETVTRANTVKIDALSREGRPFELEAEGLLAVCIQHEMDHLDGKLFIDYLSNLKRQRIRRKLEKEQRQKQSQTTTDRKII
ncbi:MAG: peptide deformylase [Gammaproteobacteria bacterium]|nr:peptide deformylase [Gammaproteobacteria bacterium]